MFAGFLDFRESVDTLKIHPSQMKGIFRYLLEVIMVRIIVALFLISFLLISPFYAFAEQYGAPFDEKYPLKPISYIFKNKDSDGKIYTFEGEITAQCKNDGCWFKLRDDTGEVLIDLKPYNFRLPTNMEGKKVKLNGKIDRSKKNVKVEALSVLMK
jgi:uncharacterized protein YdeI (BOF family)